MDPKQNPEAHHEHLHEAHIVLTLFGMGGGVKTTPPPPSKNPK